MGIEIVRVAGSHVDESLVEREEEIANRNGMENEKKKKQRYQVGGCGVRYDQDFSKANERQTRKQQYDDKQQFIVHCTHPL